MAGANFLTDGSASIARRMGVSDLIVGLTVMAFGTSAPEFVISFVASLQGNPGLAVGNVVGSNIFNVLAIIGITAMVRPIVMERSVLLSEMPIMVMSAVLLLILGNDGYLDGAPHSVVSRSDGLLLLVFFMIFLRYTVSKAKTTHQKPEPVEAEHAQTVSAVPVWRAVLFIMGGLGALIWGGDRFVAGASGVARLLGASETLIGLTIVAFGTSLPELATSIVAALKGRSGLAVGNVVGSNVFNVLFVLGGAAVAAPLPFGGIGNFDLLVLLGGSLLFWLFGTVWGRRTVNRAEGALLTLAYILYLCSIIWF